MGSENDEICLWLKVALPEKHDSNMVRNLEGKALLSTNTSTLIPSDILLRRKEHWQIKQTLKNQEYTYTIFAGYTRLHLSRPNFRRKIKNDNSWGVHLRLRDFCSHHVPARMSADRR